MHSGGLRNVQIIALSFFHRFPAKTSKKNFFIGKPFVNGSRKVLCHNWFRILWRHKLPINILTNFCRMENLPVKFEILLGTALLKTGATWTFLRNQKKTCLGPKTGARHEFYDMTGFSPLCRFFLKFVGVFSAVRTATAVKTRFSPSFFILVHR